MRRVALLRGVNLGGRRLLMTDLTRIAVQLGFARVETLLASGNLVFEADGPGGDVETLLERALAKHGLVTDVLVRDRDDLDATIAANPFAEAVRSHPSHVLVTFHREPVPLEALARLAASYDGGERLHAAGRELYIDFLGRERMRETRLVQAMAKARFPRLATGRNWNTVTRLAAMLAS